MNKILLFSRDCTITEGACRDLIVDLTRQKIVLIPKDLTSFVEKLQSTTLGEVLEFYNKSCLEILKEYYSFLIENEYVIPIDIDELSYFPKLELDWDYPKLIDNCMCEFDEFDLDNIEIILNIVSIIRTSAHELIIKDSLSLENFEELNYILQKLHFTETVVTCFYNDNIDYSSAMNKFIRIVRVNLFNAPKSFDIGLHKVFHSSMSYYNLCCGIVHPSYFTPNIPHFTEAQQHNTCLNRKIAIDAEGNIKNCPSMTKSYGNIRDTTLMEAIEKPGFKDCWTIRKDDTVKCKDCEFRYICTDCRAYTDSPEHALTADAAGLYSAPLKCGYDPYTCTWEEWSTHPLKQKAIDFYEMRDIL